MIYVGELPATHHTHVRFKNKREYVFINRDSRYIKDHHKFGRTWTEIEASPYAGQYIGELIPESKVNPGRLRP